MRSTRTPFLVWSCRSCGGVAVTLANLRHGIRHDVLQRAWTRTVGAKRNAGLRCPGCPTTMYRVPTEGPEVDLCRVCQTVWFDAGELDEMPRRSAAELAAIRKAERWEQERREWRRRRERDEEFLTWLLRHPIATVSWP